MKATFLVDNETLEGSGCGCEWGLSVLVEQDGTRVLLDTGATGLFAENARMLGVDLASVQAAVLSHAHFDHSGGFDEFFAENPTAPLYLHESAAEDCYALKPHGIEYIGVPEGVLSRFKQRIRRISEKTCIAPGFWVLPHTTPGLEEVGRASKMYRGPRFCGTVPNADQLAFDDFSHEVSLVVEVGDGIAVFNSCSHAGADVVVAEAQAAWPGRRVRAVVGGFHLFEKPEGYVRAFARRLRATGVELVCTGHCTGAPALGILRDELGANVVVATAAGLEVRL